MAVLTLKDVPNDLRNQFKAACALQGKNMREAILDFMRKEVERGRPKK
jgi:porphobilinogen deaminase